MELYKSFDEDITDAKFEEEYGTGLHTSIGWERLKPYIEHAIGKRFNEKIVGVKITEKGLFIKLEKKENDRLRISC